MSNTSPFIVSETRNGSGLPYSVYTCNDDADFIARISELASRSGETIDSVEAAVSYLDERHAQRTQIITEAEFKEQGADAWCARVLLRAERLGWHEPAAEEADAE